jgi:hypothetical protein
MTRVSKQMVITNNVVGFKRYLAHLYQYLDECTTIVTLGHLGDRLGAVFHANLDENIMGLLWNKFVSIAENSDFRLTDKGVAECRNRCRTSNS